MPFKHFLFFFWAFAILAPTNQLSAQDFSKIDAQARRIRVPSDPNIKTLAAALSANCKNEKEKARSFFIWISANIHYDIKSFNNKKPLSLEKRLAMQTPVQVIKRKKAVCEGYTNLFNALCSSVGIKAIGVGGFTKNKNGTISPFGHAWSLICADGQWGLVDATWGAGVVNTANWKYRELLNDALFFAVPEKLIEDHYPSDPLLQCLPNPVRISEFKKPGAQFEEKLKGKMEAGAVLGFENISDSLAALFPMDSIQYLLASGERSLRLNPDYNYGYWAIGKHYFKKAVLARERYYQAILNLKPLNFYPTVAWFDAQLPNLKDWEAYSQRSLEVLKSASGGRDIYSNQMLQARNSSQNNLNAARRAVAENPKLKASVEKGIRVRLTSN